MTLRLAQLRGTRAEGSLRISEAGINDALHAAQQGAERATVEVRESNRLVIRYGVLHAQVRLPAALDAGPTPRLTLTLASVLVAWGLKATLRQPYVHIHGRHVTVELAEAPVFREWRDAWQHLRRVEFATEPGALGVSFAVLIPEQSHA